jgi:guanylate kinase
VLSAERLEKTQLSRLRPQPFSKEIMGKTAKGNIIILSGPSGAGKTSIHERILKSKKLKGKVARSISMTTRERRKGERNGRDYFFVTKKMFEYKIRAGHFLEWAKVFTDYYGTPEKYVRDLLKQGKSVLLCIDVQGARQVMKKCPEAVSIFVKAPSLAELKKRLKKRATETREDLALRLKTAKKEMRQARSYGFVVINDVLARTCTKVEKVILREI